MSKMIEVECQCGKLLRVPCWRSGQKGNCTHCESLVQIAPYVPQQKTCESLQKDDRMEKKRLLCQYCGQKIAASGDYCENCQNLVREKATPKESHPKLVSEKTQHKYFLVWITVVIIVGTAFVGYRYRAVIFPQAAKQGESKLEGKTKQDSEIKVSVAQAAQTSVREYQKWRDSWDNFRKKEFPLLVKNRNFDQAYVSLANFRSRQKTFAKQGEKKSLNISETLRDLKNIEQLFARSQKKLNEYKKAQKTIQIKLFNGKSYRGKILSINDKKKNFVLRHSRKNNTIPFKNLSSIKLEQLLTVKFSKDGKVLCSLGVLFYYEGNEKKCKKYLRKSISAKKKYKPAKIMYYHFYKTGKLR